VLKGGFHLRRTNQLANELGVSEAIIESRGMGLVHVQPLVKGRASTRVIFSDTPVLRATGWSSPPRRLSPKAAAGICWQCDFRRKTLNFATECVRAQTRFYFSWRKVLFVFCPAPRLSGTCCGRQTQSGIERTEWLSNGSNRRNLTCQYSLDLVSWRLAKVTRCASTRLAITSGFVSLAI